MDSEKITRPLLPTQKGLHYTGAGDKRGPLHPDIIANTGSHRVSLVTKPRQGRNDDDDVEIHQWTRVKCHDQTCYQTLQSLAARTHMLIKRH